MSVTHFNLEHKIKPGVNAEYPPCMYKSLKHNLSSRLKSVWGVHHLLWKGDRSALM